MKHLALFLLVLAGCASPIPPLAPERFTGPDGRDAYTMNCVQKERSCYQMAGELCPGGYDIVNSTRIVLAIQCRP